MDGEDATLGLCVGYGELDLQQHGRVSGHESLTGSFQLNTRPKTSRPPHCSCVKHKTCSQQISQCGARAYGAKSNGVQHTPAAHSPFCLCDLAESRQGRATPSCWWPWWPAGTPGHTWGPYAEHGNL